MTRKRLWTLTALACALLLMPSVPRIHLPSLRFPRIDARSLPSSRIPGVALLLLALAVPVIVRRSRRTPADLAVALARRGRPVAKIARQTRLSQDVVRDLLGGEPMAVSTARRGRFFRRRKPATPEASDSFAEELSERSFDAKG